jgi:hypothetical protein
MEAIEDKPGEPAWEFKVDLQLRSESEDPEGRRVREFVVVANTPSYRDNGMILRVTEWYALRAEKWAARALNAFAAGGGNVGAMSGVAGMSKIDQLRRIGLFSLQAMGGLNMDIVDQLLDQMLECVAKVPDPRNPMLARPLMPNDIRELPTLLAIRAEVLNIHLDFSRGAAHSTSKHPGSAAPASHTTQTSRAPSGSPSHQAMRASGI